MKKGKKYQDSVKLIEANTLYDTNEALELVEKTAKAQDLDFLSSKKSSTLTTRPLMSSVLKASELNLSLLWKKQNKNKNTAENLFFNY